MSDGTFDPVGANSTTYKYGSASGDIAKPGSRPGSGSPPTSPANFLMAVLDAKQKNELDAAADAPAPKLKVVK